MAVHQLFLPALTANEGDAWGGKLRQASTEQLRALRDLICNLYSGVVPLPTEIKMPQKTHIKEIRRLSGLRNPLYECRALLLSLGRWLLPFVRAGLEALEV